jgi:DMSO/TMAO reductase YedYZ heme-binding membrane subunit
VAPTRIITRGRGRGRPAAGERHAEHRPGVLVYAAAAVLAVAVAAAGMRAGHAGATGMLHFLLEFGGVFALIGLTASVGIGLVATDRIIMSPGNRVLAQAVHRAVSFGALAFLVIHITLEITAPRLPESPTQHVHIIDAFVPFLSQYRTFYMGLGTIASDLIILIIATSIVRRRYTARSSARTWRLIHYTSYAAFVLGVVHGLLAGREAKSYVDWSYGLALAITALGVAVRYIAASLRAKESGSAVHSGPVPVHSGPLPRFSGAVPASVISGPLPLPGGAVTGSGPLPRLGGAVPASVISGPLPRPGGVGRNLPVIQDQGPRPSVTDLPAYLPDHDAPLSHGPGYAGRSSCEPASLGRSSYGQDRGARSSDEPGYAGRSSCERDDGMSFLQEASYLGRSPHERLYAEPSSYEPAHAGRSSCEEDYVNLPLHEVSRAGRSADERDDAERSSFERDYGGRSSYEPGYAGPPSNDGLGYGGRSSYEPGYAGPLSYGRDYAEPSPYESGYAGLRRVGSPRLRDGDLGR